MDTHEHKQSLRTPLAKVRGLGSAKEGVEHWWHQRLTSLALIPLTLWFVYAVVTLSGADYKTVAAWGGAPLNAIFLVLLIGTTFHHTVAGCQVVIEDYVHNEVLKTLSLITLKFVAIVLAAAGIFAVLKLALGH
jgi:succinate dehydrogenase / fumarate reductase membrane anchor subunit